MTSFDNEDRELGVDALETVSGGALNGLNHLIAVTQMKTSDANAQLAAAAAQAKASQSRQQQMMAIFKSMPWF